MTSGKPTRVGVLGAGQLALMLADAGRRIGVEVICAGQPGDCAERAAPLLVVDLDDAAQVAAFAAQNDVVTIESENISASVLDGLKLHPNANAIAIAQDRLSEKRFFLGCGIDCAPFAPVDSIEDLQRAVMQLGLPAILKTRRLGYDGKGQVRIQSSNELAEAIAEIGEVPCILEGMVRFQAEVSLIAARGLSGEIVFYPLIENVHSEGILRRSTVPFAGTTPALQARAESYLRSIMEKLEYVGVLAVEFFLVNDSLIANEMAPRVHNSGHWTIEGAATSQFENHLRAITGMELGDTVSVPTVMLNCIGEMPTEGETSATKQLHRHDYGKSARAGRKVGHLTFPASEVESIGRWYSQLNPED
jgi:5-(carboxyamino)imidazole ribonucleotide synthase